VPFLDLPFFSLFREFNGLRDRLMSDTAQPADYRVGDWWVRVDRHELCRGDETRRVQPRLMALLGCLAAAGGRTVSRDELLEKVWARRMVNDEVLSRAVANLRRALDDDARQPVLIETVPKLGYRLCVPALPVDPIEGTLGADSESGLLTSAPAVATAAPAFETATRTASETAPATSMATASHLPRSPVVIILIAALVGLLAMAAWWRWPDAAPDTGMPLLTPGDLVHARPLASAGTHNLTPRFSRRGGLYAYSAVSDSDGSATLRIRSRDGRVDAAIDSDGHRDVCPVFTDDGSELIWTRHGDDGCRIMRAALTGGEPLALATCAADAYSCPDLSPDGQRLIYSAAEWTGLAEVHLGTGDIREITRVDTGRSNDTDARFAADGRRIAFLRGRSSDRQPMMLDLDSGEPYVVSFPDARVYGLTWLDDGHLLLATDSEGPRALVSVALVDGQRILLGAPGARRPDRAADGAVIWEVARYQAHLWQLGQDGTEVELTSHKRSDGHPMLSPDGSRLVMQSNREGPDSIWLIDLATGAEQRLPLPSDTLWLYPSWLPDGSGLLMIGQAAGASQAWRYRFGSAAPERIEGIGDDVHEVQAASDGSLWFLRDDDRGQRRLWRLPSASDTAVAVSRHAVAAYRVHHAAAYMQQPDSDVVWQCRADTDDCIDTGIRLGTVAAGAWTVSDAALFHQQVAPEGGVRIMRRALQPGSVDEPTGWTMPTVLSRGLAVSADGRTAFVARASLRDVELAWLPPPQTRLR
jgi:DNA-binding winged helix-turn-helix (wHTH) protein/Tol biopolymer transport system component